MKNPDSIRTSVLGLALLALCVGVGAAPAEARKGGGAGARGRDMTAPTITCPSDMTVEAERSFGAAVAFTVTATDDKDPSPVVVVSPTSGSVFPVGTTTVTSTATDWRGNTSSCTFAVTVLPLTQTVLPPEGVRNYKVYWTDSDSGFVFYEWEITVAADGSVSGTGHQTEVVTDCFWGICSIGPIPSGLSGDGVVSGTLETDGSGQLTSSSTYWVWIEGDYDADGNPVYTQRTLGFSGSVSVAWDSAANLFYFPPDPLVMPYGEVWNVWYVQ